MTRLVILATTVCSILLCLIMDPGISYSHSSVSDDKIRKPSARNDLTDDSLGMTTKPSMQMLHNLKPPDCQHGTKVKPVRIVEQIGIWYYEFGIHLLNDDSGTKLASIRQQNFHDTHSIIRDILTQWLLGRGDLPVTWETFIKALYEG